MRLSPCSLRRALACSLGLAWFSFSPLPALAGARVTWKTNGVFLRVLLQSPELSSRLTGVKPTGAFDELKSSCVADVYRPDRDEGWKSSADNKITCTYLEVGKETAASEQKVVLSLATANVQSWGSKFDRPVHFTIDDAAARPLLVALRAAWKKDATDPWLSNVGLCGPDGSCTDIYFLNIEPKADAPASLGCDESLNSDGSVFHTRCNFMSF